MIEEEKDRLYTVEKILNKKKEGNKVKYLVKWEGYPMEDSTWEPEENLEYVQGLIDEFEHGLKDIYKQKKRGRPRKIENDNSDSDSDISRKKSNKIIKYTGGQLLLDQYLNLSNANVEKDEVETILSAKRNDKNCLICQVRWKIRSDGIQPDDSYVENKYLKKRYPKLLIEFYESKIKFINKKYPNYMNN